MTATVSNKLYTILDQEFELGELRDIAIFGMSMGVSGFILTQDCVQKFNENEDLIEDYLSDWYHDNKGENNYIKAIADDVQSIDELKNKMVWAYLEHKADEIICSVDADY
jgi:hypothetical protein